MAKELTFEERLDKLFAEAIGVQDTIWYTKTETLRDAILREYNERTHEIKAEALSKNLGMTAEQTHDYLAMLEEH